MYTINEFIQKCKINLFHKVRETIQGGSKLLFGNIYVKEYAYSYMMIHLGLVQNNV